MGTSRREFVVPSLRSHPTRSQSFSVAVPSAAVRIIQWPRSRASLQTQFVLFFLALIPVFTHLSIQKGKQVEQPVADVEDTLHPEPSQPVSGPSDAPPSDHPPTQQQQGQDPAQQPTTTTTTATTTNATLKPTTSTDTPPGEKHVVDEKDKGSLSTSAGTRTHFGLKGNKSSSEGALSASDATTATSPTRHGKSSKSQTKQSFLNRLVRVLIPCVIPSSRAHDIEPPGDVPPTVTVPAVKEKPTSVSGGGDSSSPVQNGRTVEPAQSSNQTGDPSTSSMATPQQPTSRADAASRLPEDATQADPAAANDLNVASTPSKTLLPVEGPEGVMSGAVQPPGSRGDDVVHTRTHSQDSGDESDATTTFTEEDGMDGMDAIDELEDEEERLIMNGGVGIPIGPVSVLLFPAS